ncbi:MAG: SLC13 family permease [Micavibrio sp.]|nr:SLC13 family permease [Micavibrio sp.]
MDDFFIFLKFLFYLAKFLGVFWPVNVDVVDPTIHMLFALAVTVLSVASFIRERFPIEVTSIALLTSLLLFGQFFPILNNDGTNLLDARNILMGFANPSLIAVLALLVMGQAMIQTDALRLITNLFVFNEKNRIWLSITILMFLVCFLSAFMNNTPLVVIAIPLMQALAQSAGFSQSRVMMPLSFVAILGGMTTLVGSSTNLLVSSAMIGMGYEALDFFSFAVAGSILAAVGFVYVVFVLPWMLSDRGSMMSDFAGSQKEFVAEIDIPENSPLIGAAYVDGSFADLANLNVKLIQRSGHLILPPFENYVIEEGDILIVSASRDALGHILSKYPGFLLSEEQSVVVTSTSKAGEVSGESRSAETRVMAEIMITPASRLVDMSLEHVNFQRQFGTIILCVQRRAKAVRRRLGRIRLEAGDVLLVTGARSAVDAMRNNTDAIVLSGSKRELLLPRKAPVATLVFIFTILSAAMGIVSIPVAAITGAAMMIALGCLNIRQATRAIDRKIFLLVGSMLALGVLLEVSGAAEYLAEMLLTLPFAQDPISLLALLFILVAVATNVLTNNACAILFTPIAMQLANVIGPIEGIDVSTHFLFAVTVIFGANCSFASPIGYQTNLLIMGPGHYRFRDFIKAGAPLMLLLWVVYILILKYYYGL